MKVYEIYSGQPKKFGLTIYEQIAGLASVIPPLWLENYWLILITPPVFIFTARVLTQEENNIMVRIQNFLMPSYIRGKFSRHTFLNKLIEKK